MSTVVWKTVLSISDEQTIDIPADAQMLCAAAQGNNFCIWYRCSPDAPKAPRRIRIAGTGHPISDEAWTYIGTCFYGALVFHIFWQ